MKTTTTTTTNTPNAPKRYAVIITTEAKAAADLAAKEAGKAERKAANLTRKARKAAKTAATVNTPEAATIATEAKAAADLATTEAATIRAEATRKATDPAAFLYASIITATDPAAAHLIAERQAAEMTARRIFPPFAAFRCYLCTDTKTEAEATEAARATLEAAKAAYTKAAERAEAEATEAATLARAEAAATVAEARKAYGKAEAAKEAAEALTLEAAEGIARRTAKNATEREGTPKQWKIRAAAEARDRFDPDFSDMIAAALEALTAATFGNEATAADLESKAAAILAKAADPDPVTRAEATPATIRAARSDLLTAAAVRERLTDPAAPFWIAAAYLAAYTKVNDHLTDCRAVRVSESPAPLSLDEIDPEWNTLTAPEADPEAEARAAILSPAFVKIAAALTPTRRNIWKLAGRGYSPEAIAAKMGRAASTICEHIAAIRTTAAAVLKAEAPDLAAALLAAEVTEAADLAALKAKEAKAKATATAAAVLKAATPAEAAKAKEAATKAEATATAAKAKAAEAPATLAAATLAAAVGKLSPIRREIWGRLAKGESVKHISEAMKRDRKTTREHIAAIRSALAAAMEATAPDLAEALKAADLATVAAALA